MPGLIVPIPIAKRKLKTETDFFYLISSPGAALTLAGRKDTPPSTVFRDCSGAVCNTELKRCITDASFEPDIIIFDLFLGQVRSLTYDIIRKPSPVASYTQK